MSVGINAVSAKIVVLSAFSAARSGLNQPPTKIKSKKIHALVIPKGKYIDLDDFALKASSEEMVGLFKGINLVAKKLGISTEVGNGYRALTNISSHGGQEVPHLHFHLFGGERVGKMVE